MACIAVSIMSKSNNHKGESEFSEMEHMNITVITSNKPYGISDGSNPLFNCSVGHTLVGAGIEKLNKNEV